MLAIRVFMVVLVAAVVGLVGSGVVAAESIPPNPTIYTGGTVTVGGVVPDDSVTESVGPVVRCIERCIVAKIQDYITIGGAILGGKYTLSVGPSTIQ